MNLKRLKGTEDILPGQIPLWRQIEEVSRRIFDHYNYEEIRTPVIEENNLFIRSVGEDTDIVKKQMYSFKDQGGRNICLRPEETASVVRAYLEHRLDKKEGFAKFFYIGPMFRSERPQAGRLRQFHQIGVEAIGSYSPYLDAEVIILLEELLKAYKVPGYKFLVNTLGCDEDKKAIKARLRKDLQHDLNRLCEDCRRRYDTNILRILDCKNGSCRDVIYEFSQLMNYALSDSSRGLYCQTCRDEFRRLMDILDEAKVDYQHSSILVRGLDYYTKTVFEVVTEETKAQSAIAAGGRYDNLISDFGGPKTGACGFAIGLERVIELLSKQPSSRDSSERRDCIFIATIGEDAHNEGFRILGLLRKENLTAEIDYQQRSLKAQMRYADKIKARYVVILGEDELKTNIVPLKNMEDGSQKKVALDKLIATLKQKVKR